MQADLEVSEYTLRLLPSVPLRHVVVRPRLLVICVSLSMEVLLEYRQRCLDKRRDRHLNVYAVVC